MLQTECSASSSSIAIPFSVANLSLEKYSLASSMSLNPPMRPPFGGVLYQIGYTFISPSTAVARMVAPGR